MNDGCGILLWWNAPLRRRGRSQIGITAALSIVALIGVALWQLTASLNADNPARFTFKGARQAAGVNAGPANESGAQATSSAPNDFSGIGSAAFGTLIDTYVSLKRSGAYTPAEGEAIASTVADSVTASVSYIPYSEDGLTIDPDTSYNRMLAYRSDLRSALAPLLLNTKPELGVFDRYVESGDQSALTELTAIAGRYRAAADKMMSVSVPKDATGRHVEIANSLLQFAATLEAMTRNASDAMATLALLRTYNTAEQNVLTSFDALAMYERSKTP